VTTTTTRLQRLAAAAFAVTMITVASATSAQAQPAAAQATTTSLTDTGTWTITPSIGVGFSGDLDSGTAVYGVAAGYTYTPRLSFEGNFSYLQPEVSGPREYDAKSWALFADALYHFAGRRYVPYVAAGLGLGYASVDSDEVVGGGSFDDSSTRLVFNFGGGVERQIREKIALRGDLRYLFGGNLVPDYWRASVGVSFQLK
jgi:opacity protein-like surface antigen